MPIIQGFMTLYTKYNTNRHFFSRKKILYNNLYMYKHIKPQIIMTPNYFLFYYLQNTFTVFFLFRHFNQSLIWDRFK